MEKTSFFQKIMSQPWLQDDGTVAEMHGHDGFAAPARRIGLRFFLAIVTSLFFLMSVAYFMRRGMGGGWHVVNDPSMLWVNTGTLALASVALEWSRRKIDLEEVGAAKNALLIAGVFTIAFLAGQFMVWQQLAADGYYIAGNPATGFIYLITGVHGLHILGGLVAWANTSIHMFTGQEIEKTQLAVGLCATYWHWLLLVWIVVFGIFIAT